MKKPLKLIHLANFNSTNIGNGALISGLERLFAEDFPVKIQWHKEPWDDYTFGFRRFDRKFVDLINQYDGLVVNGAVAIHGRAYLKETGMRFELPLALMTKVRKPVIFYGISYRHFKGQEFYNQETLRKTLAAMSGMANVFFGVRNDGTKRWLEETLRVPKDILGRVHEIPDTGVFVAAEAGEYPEIIPGRRVILFSPNDEDAVYRYGDANRKSAQKTGYRLNEKAPELKALNWERNRRRLILAFANSLSKVLGKTGAQLLLVPHYLHDLRFIADLGDVLPPQTAHQATISTGLMRVGGTGYFYGRYLAADLAISMRVHSMSPCIGLGVPMIPLVTQPRMWDFLRATGLDDLGLDAFSTNLECELDRECASVLSDPDDRKRRFRKAQDAMRKQARQLNSRIFSMFLGH